MNKNEELKELSKRDFLERYKARIKKLSFKKRVIEYFNSQPWVDSDATEKRDIISASFSEKEKDKFLLEYSPILLTIERHGDRVRLLQERCNLYTVHIESMLRIVKHTQYTADLLNLALSRLKEKEESNSAEAKEAISEAISTLKSFHLKSFSMPDLTLKDDEARYEVDFSAFNSYIRTTSQYLKKTLPLLKWYLETLKEFLGKISRPELLPAEFKGIENQQRTAHSMTSQQIEEITEATKTNNKDFPLWSDVAGIEREYLSINYDNISYDRSAYLEGRNVWEETYTRLYNRKIKKM